MTNLPNSRFNARLLLPELIWLESEQIEQAKAMSAPVSMPLQAGITHEAQQWQRYLNALALLSFEQWLNQRLPEYVIQRLRKSAESIDYLEVNGFKFCLIVVEHVLDEVVRIPQAVIEQPELAAHFYVINEVSEEQALVTVRGLYRYDELIRDRHCYLLRNECYLLPLALLDAEPNHLLFYCRSLQPDAIPLPVSLSPPTAAWLVTATSTTTTLSEWLQNRFDESWQVIEQFIRPDADLSFGTRSIEMGIRRGKLINLGMQLGQQTVALLVNVTSETEGTLGVLVQLHPTGESRYLMANLKLSLRSQTGKMLQEVTARSQDNYIQLKFFRGNPGTRFGIVIQLGSESIEETFEL